MIPVGAVADGPGQAAIGGNRSPLRQTGIDAGDGVRAVVEKNEEQVAYRKPPNHH
jgi:hypothetical protein